MFTPVCTPCATVPAIFLNVSQKLCISMSETVFACCDAMFGAVWNNPRPWPMFTPVCTPCATVPAIFLNVSQKLCISMSETAFACCGAMFGPALSGINPPMRVPARLPAVCPVFPARCFPMKPPAILPRNEPIMPCGSTSGGSVIGAANWEFVSMSASFCKYFGTERSIVLRAGVWPFVNARRFV